MKKIKKTYLVGSLACILTLGASTAMVLAKGGVDKREVIIQDVGSEIKAEENDIINKIKEGEDKLKQSKFDEAMVCFKEAISKEVTNKNTYLKIKDIYIEANRKDDAYYVIKLAVVNNIDKDEMNKISEQIKTEFVVCKVSLQASNKTRILLPKKISMEINNEKKNVEITWDSFNETKAGIYTVKGKALEYDREAELSITIQDELTKEIALDLIKEKFGEIDKTYSYNRIVVYKGQEYFGFEHTKKINGVSAAEDNLIIIGKSTAEILYYLSDGKILNLDFKEIGTRDLMTKDEALNGIKEKLGDENKYRYARDFKFNNEDYYGFEISKKYHDSYLASDCLVIINKVSGLILYSYPDGMILDLSKAQIGFLDWNK